MLVGCGSTSLFRFSCRDSPDKDQSRALEDRNDSNNSLEFTHLTPLFTSLLQQSGYKYSRHAQCNCHPSDSVLREKTMEASYLVGSFPCQFNFMSVFDIHI